MYEEEVAGVRTKLHNGKLYNLWACWSVGFVTMDQIYYDKETGRVGGVMWGDR
jgi:hypothetical protein